MTPSARRNQSGKTASLFYHLSVYCWRRNPSFPGTSEIVIAPRVQDQLPKLALTQKISDL